VLPLAFLLGGALHLLREARSPATGRPPVATAPETPVGTFTAELDAGGARLVARLAPLHGERGRQEHDATVLAKRFGLPPGEPFRLELHGDPSDVAELASASFTVADARGEVLFPLEALVPRATGGVHDPIAVLLAAPSARVEGARSVMLWGTAPVGAPELVTDGDVRSASPLVPDTASCASLPRYLARLDPGAAAGEDHR
jgi:hypothetical protein